MTDKKKLSVAINGVLGKMGSTVLIAVDQADDMDVVAGIDTKSNSTTLHLPISDKDIYLGKSLSDALDAARPDVVVDFTNAEVAKKVFVDSIDRGVRVVSGSTGLNDLDLNEIKSHADKNQIGCIHASNFAVGAVLLIYLSGIASKYFDYVDLIESHHEMKVDAPSGTALSIVNSMIDGRKNDFEQNETLDELLPNTRGGSYKGINIHSARLPGRVARHEVVFGGPGQTFTMLHDSINRESFMPGVIVGIRNVMELKSLVVGLDSVLGFSRAK